MSSKQVQAAVNKIMPDATVRFGWTEYYGERVRGYILDAHTSWAKDNGTYMGATLEQALAHIEQMEIKAERWDSRC